MSHDKEWWVTPYVFCLYFWGRVIFAWFSCFFQHKIFHGFQKGIIHKFSVTVYLAKGPLRNPWIQVEFEVFQCFSCSSWFTFDSWLRMIQWSSGLEILRYIFLWGNLCLKSCLSLLYEPRDQIVWSLSDFQAVVFRATNSFGGIQGCSLNQSVMHTSRWVLVSSIDSVLCNAPTPTEFVGAF